MEGLPVPLVGDLLGGLLGSEDGLPVVGGLLGGEGGGPLGILGVLTDSRSIVPGLSLDRLGGLGILGALGSL